MKLARLVLPWLLLPALVWAQASVSTSATETPDLPPPPLVPVDPPPPPTAPNATAPTPPPLPGTSAQPGVTVDNSAPTPPPPGSTPPPTGVSPYGAPYAQPGLAPAPYAPAQPYSPYGLPYAQSAAMKKPPPEWGLMATETAFGVLTGGGEALLMYYLLLKPLAQSQVLDPTLSTIITIAVFAAAPLATAQTEVGIANGSRYYYSESWPAMLTGLGAEGLVIGLTYLTRSGFADGGEALLLVGTCAFMPIAEMVVLNLVKQPKNKIPYGTFGGAVAYSTEKGFQLGSPIPLPYMSMASTTQGVDGIQVALLKGVF